ncbi:tyrosine-type recombinase/integrase [Bradyrhizobium cenepequi]
MTHRLLHHDAGHDPGKRPLRHIARFILIGLYTGTRAGAIASASPYRDTGRSYVDLEHGIFYRLARGRRPTKKRQPPAPIPERLLAHMRRWVRTGAIVSHFVEFNGAAVKSVKSGFRSAVGLAKLSTEAGKVTPHTLRHTAATWLMQRGADPWKAAGFLGMSVEVLLDTYGHHHPEFLRDAAAAITTKPSKNIVSGVDCGVDLAAYRERRRKA